MEVKLDNKEIKLTGKDISFQKLNSEIAALYFSKLEETKSELKEHGINVNNYDLANSVIDLAISSIFTYVHSYEQSLNPDSSSIDLKAIEAVRSMKQELANLLMNNMNLFFKAKDIPLGMQRVNRNKKIIMSRRLK